MFHTRKKIILASQSPRRKSFLEAIGLDFCVVPAAIDELRKDGEDPQQFVQRMAHEKAMNIAINHPDVCVLSADTIVYIDDMVYGKPRSSIEAVDMLMSLAGRQHNVMTSYCLCCRELNIDVVEQSLTGVWFTPFSRDTAQAYVRTGEPFDKAGSYGIQGRGGMLVERIDGSYSNVVGLPLAGTITLLQRYKVIGLN